MRLAPLISDKLTRDIFRCGPSGGCAGPTNGPQPPQLKRLTVKEGQNWKGSLSLPCCAKARIGCAEMHRCLRCGQHVVPRLLEGWGPIQQLNATRLSDSSW